MEEIYKTSRSVIDYKKHFFISILMIAFALIFTINYLPNLIPVLPVMSEDSDSLSIPTPSSLEKIEKLAFETELSVIKKILDREDCEE